MLEDVPEKRHSFASLSNSFHTWVTFFHSLIDWLTVAPVVLVFSDGFRTRDDAEENKSHKDGATPFVPHWRVFKEVGMRHDGSVHDLLLYTAPGPPTPTTPLQINASNREIHAFLGSTLVCGGTKGAKHPTRPTLDD